VREGGLMRMGGRGWFELILLITVLPSSLRRRKSGLG